MSNFESKYASILEDVITRGKNERRMLKEAERELLDFIDPEIYIKIFRASSAFPDVDDLQNRTYQAVAYIGYIRGMTDMLDSFSDRLRVSFIETPDKLGEAEE